MSRTIAITTLLAALSGCATVRGRIPPAVESIRTGHFQAGAARVDITPPPGFPMGGHSLAGEVGTGHWLRLKARALWIEDADGDAIALAVADLWAMPEGLVDRVAGLLSEWGIPITRERLVLAATHTHQSPAAYSSDRFFTLFASAWPGFDPRLHEFLAWRLAAAVKEAYDARQPARATLASVRARGIFRNRSMPAFLADPESATILRENKDLPECPYHELYPDCRACRAVDPTVRVVRFEQRDGYLIAAAVFLAGHPTIMSAHATVYGSDVFGASAAMVERHLAGASALEKPPVVAIFNGAEGDVSFAWTVQERPVLLTLATALSDAISRGLRLPGLPVDGRIQAARTRVQLPGSPVGSATVSPSRTAWVGFPGRATMCGAEDGPSWVPHLVSHEGFSGLPCGPQGRKIGALEIGPLRLLPILTSVLTATIAAPPREVPVSVIRIGTLALATLPGEFTTVVGRRVRTAILDAATSADVSDVALVGLANGYTLYVATPEEYALQHYEGSQTLYGPAEGPLFIERLGTLAAHLDDTPPDSDGSYAHQSVLRHVFGLPRDEPSRGCDDGTRYAMAPDSSQDLGLEQLPSTCWYDMAPVLGPSPRPVVPSVAVEVEEGVGQWRPLLVDGIPESDEGLRFVTLGRREGTTGSYWCSYWIPPASIDHNRHYRFNVTHIEGRHAVGDVELVLKSSAAWCRLDSPERHRSADRPASGDRGRPRHQHPEASGGGDPHGLLGARQNGARRVG